MDFEIDPSDPDLFVVDLTKWDNEKDSNLWHQEYECPRCFKLFRAEVSLQYFTEGMDSVPVVTEISSGFFLIRDMYGMTPYPVSEDNRETIEEALKFTSMELTNIIIEHFMHDPEAHITSAPKLNREENNG